MKRRLITAILTFFFLGAMFGSLFHVTMGMGMTGDMSGCPFMEHGGALCSMSVFAHFTAWENTFIVIAPTLLALFIVSAAAVLFISIAPNLAIPQKLLHVRCRFSNLVYRSLTYLTRPLQDLFSNGILHPKLF